MNDVYSQQLLNQIEKIEKEYKTASATAKKVRKDMETIAEKVCNFKYAQRQLGGPNQIFAMSDGELRDFIIENVLEQKNNFMKSLKDVQELYLEENKEREALAAKVISLQNELDKEKQKVSPLMPNSQASFISTNNPPTSQNSQNQQQTTKIPENNQEEVVSKQNIVSLGGTAWDVQTELNKINIYQEEIIKVMGEYGYSETKQIFEEVMKRIDVQETTLKNQMAGLVDGHFVDAENIATFLRRNLALYGLLPLGEEIYKHLTNKNPKKSEKEVLRTQHSTLKHAYYIKDTKSILEELGYRNVSIDSSQNQIQVAGGNRYVPDIIADFDENKKTYWEVELAHHTDGDFFEKLQKAAKVTDTLYIIAPAMTEFNKLKTQIGKYKVEVVTKGLKTKMTIFLGTMNHLKKREI